MLRGVLNTLRGDSTPEKWAISDADVDVEESENL